MYQVILGKRYKKSLKKLLRSGRFEISLVEDAVEQICHKKPLP